MDNNNALTSLGIENMGLLRGNSYPGRMIIVGKDRHGNCIMISAIMGRSETSRNRIYVAGEDGTVSTEPFDKGRDEDTSLTIYPTMVENRNHNLFAVSNGHQTADVVDGAHFENLHQILVFKGYKYEPDEPNFTPRITAIYDRQDGGMEIAILKRSVFGDGCDRQLYYYPDMGHGFGYCITTYDGDGKPLPAFSRTPFLVPLYLMELKELAEYFWDSLNIDNRVALAVKRILHGDSKSEIYIINKHVNTAV